MQTCGAVFTRIEKAILDQFCFFSRQVFFFSVPGSMLSCFSPLAEARVTQLATASLREKQEKQKQKSREAEKQRSRQAEKQEKRKSREAKKQKSRETEQQNSRKAGAGLSPTQSPLPPSSRGILKQSRKQMVTTSNPARAVPL